MRRPRSTASSGTSIATGISSCAKPVLMGEDGAAKAETRAMIAWARDEILKLLHPFMPFITEELWAVTASATGLLVLAPWPRKARVSARAEDRRWRAGNSGEPDRAGHVLALDADDFSDPRSGSRDRLGGRPRHRDPFGARGNEHSAGDADAAGARRVRPPRPRSARSAGTTTVKRLARLSDISFADRRAGRRGAASGARRGRGAAAEGRDRSCRPSGRGWTRKSPRPTPTSSASTPSSPTRNSSPTRPKSIVEEEKEKREAARSAQGQDPRGAGAAEERFLAA